MALQNRRLSHYLWHSRRGTCYSSADNWSQTRNIRELIKRRLLSLLFLLQQCPNMCPKLKLQWDNLNSSNGTSRGIRNHCAAWKAVLMFGTTKAHLMGQFCLSDIVPYHVPILLKTANGISCKSISPKFEKSKAFWYHLIDDSWQYQRNLRYQILHHCFTSVEHKIAQKIDAFYDFLILFYKCLTKIAQKWPFPRQTNVWHKRNSDIMAGVGFAYYHAKSEITCPYAHALFMQRFDLIEYSCVCTSSSCTKRIFLRFQLCL